MSNEASADVATEQVGSEFRVEIHPTDSITPYKNNPRLNDKAVDAVAESLKEFGFWQPIVVDPSGVIIAGHTRFRAAQKLQLFRFRAENYAIYETSPFSIIGRVS